MKKYTKVTFSNGSAVETPIDSYKINPGDLIKITDGQSLPVDFLILFSCNYADDNKCYIETSNLDGEIDLKLKEGPANLSTEFPQVFKTGVFTEELFKSSINCQAPNKNIHKFVGTLKPSADSGVVTQEAMPLQARNLILRGSVLKNTGNIVVLFLYIF
jgi:phospholipid-translocating ATPase